MCVSVATHYVIEVTLTLVRKPEANAADLGWVPILCGGEGTQRELFVQLLTSNNVASLQLYICAFTSRPNIYF